MKNKEQHNSIVDGKERFFVISGLIVAYVVLFILIMVLFNALQEREDLKLQTEAEKSFNTVFFHLQEDPVRASNELAENGIIGVGVYTNIGRNILMLGNVPRVLSADVAPGIRTVEGDYSSGKATYDDETGNIEYVRYINRLTLLLDIIDDSKVDLSSFTTPTLQNQDVLYIVLNGKSYHMVSLQMRAFQVLALIILSLVFLAIYHIYMNNRGYRETLEKQRSLVNLGQAARTLTHEIKNPLSSVNIQLAILRLKINPKYKQNLEVIQSLSTFRSNFSEDYGIKIVDGPLAGVTGRAVLVLDENNAVIHSELVPEIAQEPDYDSALASL